VNANEEDEIRSQAREDRAQVKGMFLHAFNSYMDNAWPWDELMPLSCTGRRWDQRNRGTIDDILGGFSLTLIDSLDSLAVFGLHEEFIDAVERVIKNVHFDRDVTISVFESTIRVLGGLLSAHLLLANNVVTVPKTRTFTYEGELLELAEDLGNRLLPAFESPTGIPFHRINLQRGVESTETFQTCAAAAGTLLLEFGLLSRLTGDPIFERKARRAIVALWERRDPGTGLLGNTININNGRWLSNYASTGAGVDSFYEYLIKSFLILDDTASPYITKHDEFEGDLLQMFNEAMQSVDEHLSFGPWHIDVNMNHGRTRPRNFVVSALQAFWPGLQALIGDVDRARESHRAYFSIWAHFGGFPELFDIMTRQIPPHYGSNYFLRPELAESTMILYEKTQDPYYLKVGAKIMRDIEAKCRVACGYATLRDVSRNEGDIRNHEDRMDSYFLSETLKYLYMLFDMGARNSTKPTELAGDGKQVMFSTEGHIFFLPPSTLFSSTPMEKLVVSAKNASPARNHASDRVRARVSVEYVVSPFIHIPVVVPDFAKKRREPEEFVLTSADLGGAHPTFEKGGYVVISADPFDACGELSNVDSIRDTIEASRHMRMDGSTLHVAVLVERGSCSIAAQAANLGNLTGASTIFVVKDATDVHQGNTDFDFTCDESTDENSLGQLSHVSSFFVPRAFAQLVHSSSFSKTGFGSLAKHHTSHQLVVTLSNLTDGKSGQAYAWEQKGPVRKSILGMLIKKLSDKLS